MLSSDPDYFQDFRIILSRLVVLAILFASFVICQLPTYSYPEFQAYSEKISGRTVDCAMCHVNAYGPMGDAAGQLGSLSPADIEKVNQVRLAMSPGNKVDSPILNKFGNQIIETLGGQRFIEIKSDPSKLAPALGKSSDLDGDGIPDSTEYLDGTDPLNKYSGNPYLLFFNNFSRYWGHILLAFVAIALIGYGIINLLKAFVPNNLSKPNSSASNDSDLS